MFTRLALAAVCIPLLGAAPAGEPAAPPAFAKKPTATRDGDKVKVEFAADRETDVAVYIEKASGEIVRHLVAGVLGKNPPEPLKAGSLEQSVAWDGRDDDGKPAAGGPFKVRVGLGLKVSWGGLAFAEPDKTGPNRVESIMGLAAGPDGRVYVHTGCAAWLYWRGSKIHVFRRDGSYEKTIKPFPANLPLERVKAAGAFVNPAGRLNPIFHSVLGLTVYPQENAFGQRPAITPDGRIVLAARGTERMDGTGASHLSMIDTEGGIPDPAYSGPALEGAGWAYPWLVPTQDGKAVLITGVGPFNVYGASKPWHAVHRAKLPERGPLEVFFGEPGKPGSDNTHLNDPRGVACDGKGNLLVADFGNNRVVVIKEADKSFVGSFPVPAPNWLAVHPKTGAVYVESGSAVVKLSGWQDPKEQARLTLPKFPENWPWRLALEASADPAGLWVGTASSLLRCEDQGTKFTDLVPAKCTPAIKYWRPAADPTRREVACRMGATWDPDFRILNEETGQLRKVGGIGGEGTTYRLGRDGSIYACNHGGGLFRLDRDGKGKPFPATKGNLPAGSTGTTMWERDWYVDRKNDIYVRKRGPEYHGLMTVEVYDQEGNHQRTALWTVSDGMYGPRVDPKGNLYIMEAVKPTGQPFPEEFSGKVQGRRAPREYDWIYGSIIKFGPEGGAVWFSGNQASPLTYEGWGSDTSVSGLRTTGGSLTGTIARKGATLNVPGGVEAATNKMIAFRLKNDSDGKQAVLSYHNSFEGYGEKAKTRSIEIKPNGDFNEYTFDLSGEKEWRGNIWGLQLTPTDSNKGTFSIDWVRIGEGDKKLAWEFNAEDGPDKKLPATMKKEAVYAQGRPNSTLQGALWYRPGFSPVGDMAGYGACHCTASDFDVDDFGRTFAPDTGRCRVGVLDTNGNEILSFGGYGNQDYCGPESYVMDPATKLLRPRQASDPKDLKSPFADPEIGLAWIVGLAVTDRYAYVDDVINKRILRVKLDYAAAETVAAP